MPIAAGKVVFNQVVSHSGVSFIPNKVVYGFEDPDAAPYFVAAGWAEDSPEDPDITVPSGVIEIDPETVFATGPNRGQKVLSEEVVGDGVIIPDDGQIGSS